METGKRKLAAGLAAACALLLAQGDGGAAGFRDAAARLLESAEAHSLKRIAVLDLSAKGGAGKEDSDYAAERLGLHLAGSRKTALIERALLERVMKEHRLSWSAGAASGGAEVLQDLLSLDGAVTGTVFADGGKLMVLARLIELRTGRVLLAVEAGAERLPQDPLDGFFDTELPFPDTRSGWGFPRATDFRDAVAGSRPSCAERRRRLGELNAELVDEKARHWAAVMRAPGFALSSLHRNPGSEIADADVKARFYRLLSAYFRSPEAPAPEGAKAVLALLETEKRVSDECGLP